MLLLGGTACLGSPVSIAADNENLPFTLSWVQGSCLHCKTAQGLRDVQFVGPDEAWAIGYVPPGQTGAGDYSILHTRDGGEPGVE
jgi:hypothetical protein